MTKGKSSNSKGVKQSGENKKKNCFFITPIGSKDSVEYKKLEGISENVLKPVLEKHQYDLVVAHKINNLGSIGEQVFKNILKADLIISNLTGLNPNVMYETAVSHSFGIPTIMICEGDTKLPFDIIEERTIFFENTISGSGELRQGIDEKIEELLKDGTHDNPVYRVLKRTQKIDEIKDGKNGSANEVILEAMFEMQDSINRLEKRSVMNTKRGIDLRKPELVVVHDDEVEYMISLKPGISKQHKNAVCLVVEQMIRDLGRVPRPNELAPELNLDVDELERYVVDIRPIKKTT